MVRWQETQISLLAVRHIQLLNCCWTLRTHLSRFGFNSRIWTSVDENFAVSIKRCSDSDICTDVEQWNWVKEINNYSCRQQYNRARGALRSWLCAALTAISVLVQISDVADRHSKHGVVGPVETDRPSLIIPVAKGVQVHVHGPSDLCFTVKEIRSSNDQIRPAGNRNADRELKKNN